MKSTKVGDLYILTDGTHVAPGDCAKGDGGILCGPNGMPVAMTSEGEPMTVRRQAELGGNAIAAEMGTADDGDLLATTQNQGGARRSAAERPENKSDKPKAE